MTGHQRNIAPPIDPVKLDRLAEVAIKVGLQLRQGQDLVLTAPAAALPLVRRITEHAYKAGAGLVTPIFSDEEIDAGALSLRAATTSFDRAAGWLYEGMAKAFAGNAARLAIVGDNPMLLSERGPGEGGARQPGQFDRLPAGAGEDRRFRHQLEHRLLSRRRPGRSRCFPDDAEDVAVGKLADAIFAASRVDGDDPVAAWKAHNAALRSRTDWLNGQRFDALHFTGPGTDLTVGLADGHEWQGGASTAKNGITCNPNIPTEEVFTTPHALRVDGHVAQHQAAVLPGHADRRHRRCASRAAASSRPRRRAARRC